MGTTEKATEPAGASRSAEAGESKSAEAARHLVRLNVLVNRWREGKLVLVRSDDVIPDWTNRERTGRSLHSSTFQLNLSALRDIGGALRGCLGGV